VSRRGGGPSGTVYLLHFETPYKHARHYVGWTEGPVEERVRQHQSGAGARLLAVVVNAGIAFHLARTWAGTRRLERRIKTLGGAARCCPVCTPGTKWGRFAREE
jgi:predicted GIY-YIG superfamily endonuclease